MRKIVSNRILTGFEEKCKKYRSVLHNKKLLSETVQFIIDQKNIHKELYYILKYGNNRHVRIKEKGVEIMGLPAILGLLIVIGCLVCLFYAVPIEK